MSQFIAESTNYNDTTNAGEDQPCGDDQPGWVEEDFNVEPSEDINSYNAEKHVKILGAVLGKHSIKDDVRTGVKVEAFHVDHERDEALDIPLSKFNLNYVFNKPTNFKAARYSDVYGATIDPATLPKLVDWRAEIGTIYDQGSVGSCVAHCVAYPIRRIMKKTKNIAYNPSRLFIYYNGRVMAGLRPSEDTGLSITEGYQSVDKYSVPDEILWPYLERAFSTKPTPLAYASALKLPDFSYVTLDNDLNQLKKCLADGWLVSFGAALFSSFMSEAVARTGIIPVPNPRTESRAGGHAMTACGYDDTKKCFIVVNSWSSRWGDKGFMYFPYQYMLNRDLCGDFCSARAFK